MPSRYASIDIDCVVVGAGVIGLAIARALAAGGLSLIIAEREKTIGSGVSSRSSEVIHAGIYYPEHSLKARLCVAGNAALYRYCARRQVPHRRCGKLIVAADSAQISALEHLANAARRNGVNDLRWLDRTAARALEPALQCEAALLSPSTGIVDSHALMLSLLGDAQRSGAVLALATEIVRAHCTDRGIEIFTAARSAPALRTRWLINCAGLDAIALAQRITPRPRVLPTPYFAKGTYFSLQGGAPFSHLIYPLPEPGGLGIHLTLDLSGGARFGPDVEWIDAPDYRVDATRAGQFSTSIRRYWPAIAARQLLPAYAGVRPKIAGPADATADFRIDGPEAHGVPGLINLFGIESPGITSALALAEHVQRMVST